MLAIEIDFLAGRYHATPWDRQVNEGIVEWPPAPWRILRALISVWYHKAKDEIDEDVMHRLIEKMIAPPEFFLPPATISHTRHYMPLYRTPLDRKTMKIFDTFVNVENGQPLRIIWHDVTLEDDERKALSILLERIGYLGRAESWVEARLIFDSNIDVNCSPRTEGIVLSDNEEAVKTLVCSFPDAYNGWREEALAKHLEMRLEELKIKAKEKGKPPESVKLGKKDRERIERELPADIFTALQVDTSDLKAEGWSQPPGSLWIEYRRDGKALDVDYMRAGGIWSGPSKLPTIVRYSVSSKVPPRLTEAVPLSDRIHRSLVSISDGHELFTGRDETGDPLHGHDHAYILCESNLESNRGKRGEITHVTIFSPKGFDLKARVTLDALRRVWGYGGNDIQLTLLGIGGREDFGGVDTARGQSPILSESNIWVSRTPFIPTRYPKVTRAGRPKLDESGLQIGNPEHDLRRLLSLAGYPEPISVDAVPSTSLHGHETRWLEFRTERNGGGSRSTNIGHGFRICFPEPVRGPIALGYGAHFGLGLFVPGS